MSEPLVTATAASAAQLNYIALVVLPCVYMRVRVNLSVRSNGGGGYNIIYYIRHEAVDKLYNICRSDRSVNTLFITVHARYLRRSRVKL